MEIGSAGEQVRAGGPVGGGCPQSIVAPSAPAQVREVSAVRAAPPPGPSSASPQPRRSSPGPLSRRNCGEGALLGGLKFGVLQAILLFFFSSSLEGFVVAFVVPIEGVTVCASFNRVVCPKEALGGRLSFSS